jgi:predicted amidohydrolase YtcJ
MSAAAPAMRETSLHELARHAASPVPLRTGVVRRLVWGVALASLFAGLSCVSAQTTPQGVPDAVFYNGKVITVDPSFSIREAFAVRGDRFEAVGTNQQVRVLAGPTTRLINLDGHTVIPGLIDDHNHQFRAASLLLRGIRLAGVTSIQQMLDRIHQAALAAKPEETVFTAGDWDLSQLKEKRPPTRSELDAASAGHPVLVRTTRGHAYLNTEALRLLGVTRATPSFAGAPVEKDDAGEPTGALQAPVGPSLPQGLQQATSRLLPSLSLQEQERLVIEMQQQQNALGLTSLRELWLSPEEMRVYQALWREKKLTIRVSMGITAFGSTPPEELQRTLSTWGVGTRFGDDWLRLDCVGELQVDGSVQNSYLRSPYANSSSPGSLLAGATPQNVQRLISLVDQYGWRPSIHVWGDKALDVSLDAYQAAAEQQGSIREQRWTVEHALLINPDQMERILKLGVLVSAQAQVYYESDKLLRYWGTERANAAEPIRDLLDHGILVGSGSDWPSLPNNPFVNFYFYVTRMTGSGVPLGVNEKVSREAALRMATINNAQLTFEEKEKGSIENGKLADFVILPEDLLTMPASRIPALLPLATYVGGREVYAAGAGVTQPDQPSGREP